MEDASYRVGYKDRCARGLSTTTTFHKGQASDK